MSEIINYKCETEVKILNSDMENPKEKALVSACLLGVQCRYDGGHCLADVAHELQEKYDLIPVCPEQMGGLATPRPAAQIENGDGNDVLDGSAKVVVIESGKDITAEFIRGAEGTLSLAKFYDLKLAFLKSRSPSCGCGSIVVDGKTIEGDGVTTAMLKREGIKVLSMEKS